MDMALSRPRGCASGRRRSLLRCRPSRLRCRPRSSGPASVLHRSSAYSPPACGGAAAMSGPESNNAHDFTDCRDRAVSSACRLHGSYVPPAMNDIAERIARAQLVPSPLPFRSISRFRAISGSSVRRGGAEAAGNLRGAAISTANRRAAGVSPGSRLGPSRRPRKSTSATKTALWFSAETNG